MGRARGPETSPAGRPRARLVKPVHVDPRLFELGAGPLQSAPRALETVPSLSRRLLWRHHGSGTGALRKNLGQLEEARLDRGGLRRKEVGFGGYEAWEEQVYAEEARAAEKLDGGRVHRCVEVAYASTLSRLSVLSFAFVDGAAAYLARSL